MISFVSSLNPRSSFRLFLYLVPLVYCIIFSFLSNDIGDRWEPIYLLCSFNAFVIHIKSRQLLIWLPDNISNCRKVHFALWRYFSKSFSGRERDRREQYQYSPRFYMSHTVTIRGDLNMAVNDDRIRILKATVVG